MDELGSLHESAREVALERFRIIQPCLEQDRSLSLIARNAGIPYRTIHRWMTQYRRFGLAALARKGREDGGKRRALSPRLLEIARVVPKKLIHRDANPARIIHLKSHIARPAICIHPQGLRIIEWRGLYENFLPTRRGSAIGR
jgi:transposase-like protein